MPKGYATSADVLVRTRDGQDLNAIWQSYQEALEAFNAARTPLIDLLSFGVTNPIEDIVQPGTFTFEKASEFGIPVSQRPQPIVAQRAFTFDWWDTRSGYTFQFLAGNGNTQGATSSQLDAILNSVMEADNRLRFEQVMKTLFNNVNRTANLNNVAYTVAALYNADGSFIPPVDGVTFAGSHSHYLASGAATLDSTDLDQLAALITEHGYTPQNGFGIGMIMNKTEADVVKNFRRGVVNNNGQTAVWDFIPAQGTGFLLPVGWEVAAGGAQAARLFAGLNVVGTYGPYLIIENANIPSAYILGFATQGSGAAANLVGIREHDNAALRGVVLRPGNTNGYPLIDSFFINGFGTGVSQRGGAAILQVTAGAYAVPASMAW